MVTMVYWYNGIVVEWYDLNPEVTSSSLAGTLFYKQNSPEPFVFRAWGVVVWQHPVYVRNFTFSLVTVIYCTILGLRLLFYMVQHCL